MSAAKDTRDVRIQVEGGGGGGGMYHRTMSPDPIERERHTSTN